MNKTENKTASHSKLEDFLALIIGTCMVAFGMIIMQQATLMTGGTAGLALLIHYVTDIPVGVLFFLINIPFYYLAYKRLGMTMVIKTFIAVVLLSVMIDIHPLFIDITSINPLYATIIANILIGIGLLILFRHRASLGGFNLLALYVQEYYKIPAGKVQMGMDVCVLLLSITYVSVTLFAISVVGVVILNIILALNHRTDRYIGA